MLRHVNDYILPTRFLEFPELKTPSSLTESFTNHDGFYFQSFLSKGQVPSPFFNYLSSFHLMISVFPQSLDSHFAEDAPSLSYHIKNHA